jgi:Zn-dependent protease
MLLSLLFSEPLLFVALVIGIVIALTVHEYSHAAMAKALGDETAERMGRLSLNPLTHLDPVGFLMLLVAGFGYAKPVPYNPYNLRHPRSGSVLIGIAGPISNILMATVFGYILKFLYPTLGDTNLLTQFLFFAAYININLAIFNFIPIPPLDGSKILLSFLNAPKYARTRYMLETQGPFLLILFIIVDSVTGLGIFSAIFETLGSAFFRLIGISI